MTIQQPNDGVTLEERVAALEQRMDQLQALAMAALLTQMPGGEVTNANGVFMQSWPGSPGGEGGQGGEGEFATGGGGGGGGGPFGGAGGRAGDLYIQPTATGGSATSVGHGSSATVGDTYTNDVDAFAQALAAVIDALSASMEAELREGLAGLLDDLRTETATPAPRPPKLRQWISMALGTLRLLAPGDPNVEAAINIGQIALDALPPPPAQ